MKSNRGLAGALLVVAGCAAAVPAANTPDESLPPTPSAASVAQAQKGGAQHPPTAARPPASRAPGTARTGVPESASRKPKTSHKSFSRRLDRKKLEARGAISADAIIASPTLAAATTFNDATWAGQQRQELLAYLRDRPADPTEAFDDDDARIIATIQIGSGAEVDGKLRDETMAVLFASGFRFSPREEGPWRVQIDFYPAELEDRGAWDEAMKGGDTYRTVEAPDGEGMLYVRTNGRVVATYRARGGPPATLHNFGGHVADPTKPGSFSLGAPHVHVTKNWENSQIPWGAEIREQGDGYQFRWSNGPWRWATARNGPTLGTPLEKDIFEDLPRVTRDGQSILLWTKNDFGPTAWQLVPSDNYVHTTPGAEEDAARGATTTLAYSHGCIHIDPGERDEMVQRGFLQAGVSFAVRSWNEHVLPDMVRSEMVRGAGAAAPHASRREAP